MSHATPAKRHTILIVDDDKNTRDGLSRLLRDDYYVQTAEAAERALQILGESEIDIMLSDVRMPGMDGLTLMQRALASQPELITILLTAYGNVEMAVEAMKLGAYDFLTKPVNLDHLELLLKRALRSSRMESENAALKEQLNDRYGLESLIGNAPTMLQLFDIIKQAAPSQATVLLQGESGTGKELVAHALHQLSPRNKRPFIPVHCAALSPSLLESELFGHEKGAFTSAAAQRRGRFEMANGGTLFLDEISEIDPAIQVKLLRVLESRCFERVGGHETIDVDIRLIAATNRNLRKHVEEGKFREDLFFRLDVVNIHVPPLRDRIEDIPLLAAAFLKKFATDNHKDVSGISQEAVHILTAYPWPGNVRELRNTLEKMVVLARGTRLTPKDIPSNITSQVSASPVSLSHAHGISTPQTIAEIEHRMIIAALRRHEGNRTLAARELGISRRTLHRKLKDDKLESAFQTDDPHGNDAHV